MKLITKVTIDHFRSIRNQTINDFGNFTALAGLNNSGKSNLLRALHAFFRNQTDASLPFDFAKDFFCHDFRSRKAKRIAITVNFDLPKSFNFRKGLEAAERLLSKTFALTKAWTRTSPAPLFYLNYSDKPVGQEDRALIEQFLSLLAFRYIPNRVMPLDIIRDEHKALRDVLVRRIAAKAKHQQDVFNAIEDTSANLISSLQDSVHAACPDVGSIRLATPTSWQDLIFAFGYKMRVKEAEIDDTAQGSGIQSLLMFETLSLIDRDYFQRFGWRQAALWAVEEPESSLHSSLEARVADYLSRLSADPKNRLQVFCTTHSDLVLQYSDQVVFASTANGETSFRPITKASALDEAARLGISRWTHPILHSPLTPVILVEGKFDCFFLEQAFKLLAPQRTIVVSCLERLQGGDATGGDKHLQQYIKANVNVIKCREHSAPVIVLLDWDSSKRAAEFRKGFSSSDPYSVQVWPASAMNPLLDESFHGIERAMPIRIIDEADQLLSMLASKRDGTRSVPKHADYDRFKSAAAAVVQKGITSQDLTHARAFLETLLKSLP